MLKDYNAPVQTIVSEFSTNRSKIEAFDEWTQAVIAKDGLDSI